VPIIAEERESQLNGKIGGDGRKRIMIGGEQAGGNTKTQMNVGPSSVGVLGEVMFIRQKTSI